MNGKKIILAGVLWGAKGKVAAREAMAARDAERRLAQMERERQAASEVAA